MMAGSMRYRCHAAVAGGRITPPAIVTVTEGGSMTVEPEPPRELYSTRHYNGAIIAIPASLRHSLPQSLPPQGLRKALAAIAPLTSGSLPAEICFIPLKR